MSKKLYEEEKIRAIAEKIREKTGGTSTYTTDTMPSGVDEAYNKGYEVGVDVIPEGYIKPIGTKSITENGTHDVTEYASVDVNVAASGSDTLAEFLSWRNGFNLFYQQTFTTVPLFDTSMVTTMESMFSYCAKLTTVPLYNTSNVTNIGGMFYGCSQLTTVPLFDTSKVKKMTNVFVNCSALTTIPAWDARSCTNFNNMLDNCKALTDVRIRNIKTNFFVSDGATYGYKLTVDSLTHLIYELRKQSYAKTLTIGSANLEKLANVYVKAVEITDEMRAEDDLIDEKYPFVVCESTDEGAMLITDYATTVKRWTIK